jgi:hypothetical protein
MIVAAALQYAHITLSMPKPARHHDVLHQLYGMLEDANEGKTNNIANIQAMCVQGFIDDQGNFLDRNTALIHAREHGPGTPRRDAFIKAGRTVYDGDELFSEDIW